MIFIDHTRREGERMPPYGEDPREFEFLPETPYIEVPGDLSGDRYGRYRTQRRPSRNPRKRFLALMAGIMAVVLSAMPVFAVTEFAAYSPNRSRIASYAEVYDAVYDAVASGLDSLDLYEYRVTVDDFLDIYSDLFTTAPEFYFLSPKVVYHSTDGLFSRHVVDVLFTYDMTRSEREAASVLYENELEYIVSQVPPGLSEAEKALFVHDYLVASYAYDESESIYDVYRMFRTRTGVCQAYSLAYCAVLRELGMESCLCVSEEMGHAWNLVRVDGNWYHVDLMYDDPEPDRLGRVLHDYFLLNDDEIAAKGHKGWDTPLTCDSTVWSKNPLWRGVDARMISVGGKWYYIDNKSNKLCRCSLSGAGKETVFEFSDRWMYEGDSKRYWVGVFSGLSIWNGLLVVNTPDEVWTVDPKTGESVPLFDPEGTLYGSNVFRGTLEYLIAETPNLEKGEKPSTKVLDTAASASAGLPFTDVPPESIYYPAVKYVYEAGLFTGVSGTKFDTGSAFSRAMFVTVLGRLCGADPSAYRWSAFSDVAADEWYTPYVAWAASTGIVNGMGDGRFAPDVSLTREQMYKIVAICGANLGVGKSAGADALSQYADRNSVSSWALEGTAWCAANGLLSQTGSIEPQKTVTRGEAAVMFAAFARLAGMN